MIQTFRLLKASSSGLNIRHATFNSKDHIVVPVVALVQGVVHASNSENPELVTIESLQHAPQGWNGRPVLPRHPSLDVANGSANEPTVLEAQSFGLVFNTHIEGTKLLMEAWLDPEKAEAVGPDAVSVINRALSGVPIEVSVGAMIGVEEVHGFYEGKEYFGEWREVVPDHLAMLPVGYIGACSNKMGCGAPRLAEGKQEVAKKTIREFFMEKLGFRKNEGASDSDIYYSLDKALFSTEPAFVGVQDVFQSDSKVVYAVAPDGNFKLLRRDFSVDDKGVVTLGESTEEVQQVMEYKTVAAEGSSCGCTPPTTEEPSMDKKQLVSALIACPKNKFSDADRAGLEALSMEALEALSQPTEKAAETPVAPASTEAKQLTEEEALALAPEATRQLVARARKAEQDEIDSIVTALTASQKEFTPDELKTRSLSELKKLQNLAKISSKADFTTRGLSRDGSEDKDSIPEAPALSTQFTK